MRPWYLMYRRRGQSVWRWWRHRLVPTAAQAAGAEWAWVELPLGHRAGRAALARGRLRKLKGPARAGKVHVLPLGRMAPGEVNALGSVFNARHHVR